MKSWQYYTLLLLAVFCLGVSAATVLVARSNIQLQTRLQAAQVKLNNGVLGLKGQQFSGNLMNALANEAATDIAFRDMMARYGYNLKLREPPVASDEAPDGSAPAPVWGQEENTEQGQIP
jgi:hypothetical protein